MTLNLNHKGFSSIASNFDLFFIDIWGVIHNGIDLNLEAINTLDQLKRLNKEFVLLTNAPRPNATVIKFLKKMGLADEHCKKVYTSGEAALKYLEKNYNKSKFFHIGPPKDYDLFFSFKENKVESINTSEFLLCTGLFEKYVDDLNYYNELLKNSINKKMICTNPDLIVDRGNVREFCAGSVAKIFEDVGGSVDYFGKPHPLVYELSADLNNKKILCVGDNLNTDIKGANNNNFESLLISGGIHKDEINKNLDLISKKYKVNFNYIQSNLKW